MIERNCDQCGISYLARTLTESRECVGAMQPTRIAGGRSLTSRIEVNEPDGETPSLPALRVRPGNHPKGGFTLIGGT